MLKRTLGTISLYFLSLLITGNFLEAQDVSLDLQNPKRLTEDQRTKLWEKIPGPMTVGYTTSSLRFNSELPPLTDVFRIWKVIAWKNEKVHTQIAIASKIKIGKIDWKITNLKNKTGQIIPKNSLTTGLVQDVMTDEFKNGCGHRTSTDFDSSLVADIINTNLHSTTIDKNHTLSLGKLKFRNKLQPVFTEVA